MNNLIAAMNHPGSAENEYIMKGESLITCKNKIGNKLACEN